jgi:hypothetical protein
MATIDECLYQVPFCQARLSKPKSGEKSRRKQRLQNIDKASLKWPHFRVFRLQPYYNQKVRYLPI